MHAGEGKSGVEVVMTMLHAGGKFDKKAYQVSGGLHGVGGSVVNALSEWLSVEVRQNGKIYQQKYKRGIPQTELEVIGEADTTGTIIRVLPDAEIFETIQFDSELISYRLRELAFLNKGLEINATDERTGTVDKYSNSSTRVATVCMRTRCIWRATATASASRSPCSITTRIRSRSSPMPTTSKRPKVAPIWSAFVPP